MKKVILFYFIFSMFSCSKDQVKNNPVETPKILEIKGADISFLPTLRNSALVFYNANNQAEDILITLKNNGVNTIRLRIWNNIQDANSSFNQVKNLTQELKNKGFKVLISVHYSDTWADPGTQTKPFAWQNSNFETLKIQVYNFTKEIMTQINPDYIQIGNEINSGFLWQEGHINNLNQMKQLLEQGIKAVKDTNANTKIILHYAGLENVNWFFTQVQSLNYDIIGISYYPIWHGKDLNLLAQTLKNLVQNHSKEILIVETSYPFTLLWNDWTNNIIGSNDQILPQYPATPNGQKEFLQKIKSIVLETPKGIGFCYWGGEWVSYQGSQATNGSSWENQAFWDFNNKVLPVLEVYKD